MEVQREYVAYRKKQVQDAKDEEGRKNTELRSEMRERKRMFKEEKRLREFSAWVVDAEAAAIVMQVRVRGLLAKRALGKKKTAMKVAAMQAKWDEEARMLKERKAKVALK